MTTTPAFPTYQIKGRTVEYKTVSFLVKSIDQDQGIVTGLASPMGNVDRQKDQVEPGAYTKTLQEGQQRISNGRRYMCATLWMHNPDQPTGGVLSGEETPEGLEVTMKYDISTNAAGYPKNPIATMVFSGFKEGYIDELSIGYIAIKYDYDKQGVRHLREIQLIEISGVTMLFAANPEALVAASGVKSMVATKGASGKASWPLADRDLAWDNGAAHNAIVKKATKADGSLDQALMKSVHFWYDASAPDEIGSYKLLFCDVIDDEIKAVPRGIFACTGGHGLAVADIPESDIDGVKAKIAGYYKRMATAFNDDSIEPSWEKESGDKRSGMRQQRKDFNSLFQATQAADCLEDLGDLLNTFVQATIQAFGMGDQPEADMQQCLEQFGSAVKDWVQDAVACDLKEYIAQRGYCGDGTPWVPYNMRVGGYDYASRHDAIASKVGRAISAANQGALEQHQAEMKDSLDAVMGHCKTMQQKVSQLTHLWQQQQDDQQDDGKSLTRREPPTALPRQGLQPLAHKSTADDLSLEEFATLLTK